MVFPPGSWHLPPKNAATWSGARPPSVEPHGRSPAHSHLLVVGSLFPAISPPISGRCFVYFSFSFLPITSLSCWESLSKRALLAWGRLPPCNSLSPESQEGLPFARVPWHQPAFPCRHQGTSPDSSQSAAGWSFRGPLALLSLPHTKPPVASPPESHSDKQTPSRCSFSSIFPPPAVSPESDRHNQGPRQPQGSWRAELSSCWFPSGTHLTLPVCRAQYLKGVDGWVLKQNYLQALWKMIRSVFDFFF